MHLYSDNPWCACEHVTGTAMWFHHCVKKKILLYVAMSCVPQWTAQHAKCHGRERLFPNDSDVNTPCSSPLSYDFCNYRQMFQFSRFRLFENRHGNKEHRDERSREGGKKTLEEVASSEYNWVIFSDVFRVLSRHDSLKKDPLWLWDTIDLGYF